MFPQMLLANLVGPSLPFPHLATPPLALFGLPILAGQARNPDGGA